MSRALAAVVVASLFLIPAPLAVAEQPDVVLHRTEVALPPGTPPEVIRLRESYLAGDRSAAAALRPFAEAGDPVAAVVVGSAFEAGYVGPGPDRATAYDWYRRAAEQDYVPALVNVARLALDGEVGVPADPAAAVAALEAAVAQDYAPAMVTLGTLAETGSAVPLDAARAAGLYDRAARLGVAEGAARAIGVVFARPELGGPARALGYCLVAERILQGDARKAQAADCAALRARADVDAAARAEADAFAAAFPGAP